MSRKEEESREGSQDKPSEGEATDLPAEQKEGEEAQQEGESKKKSPLEPEILDTLPPDVRQMVVSSYSEVSRPPVHPLASKLDSDHVHKVLDNTDEESKRGFEDKQRGRWFQLGYALIITALFVFLTVFFVDRPDTYQQILKTIILVGGGFGGGYGYKSWREK